MNKKNDILKWAREALEIESGAIYDVRERLGDSFIEAINLLFDCKGKVVTTGMGKAGIIAQKFSATLSSTGTPSLWLHPAEAVHGDLGRVLDEDLAVILSYSGETEEIKALLPFLKKIGAKVISLTGNNKSVLAQYSDQVLDVKIDKEACPLGLAPTTSTTVMLGLCDAMSVVLQRIKEFKVNDFAFYHPRGSLGRKLLLKVKDCMRKGTENPVVRNDSKVKEVLSAITSSKAGAAVIMDKEDKVVGIFTDGDLRRQILKSDNILDSSIGEVMTKKPVMVDKEMLAAEAMRVLEDKKIDEVPVVDKDGSIVGLLDVQDLLRAGVVL